MPALLCVVLLEIDPRHSPRERLHPLQQRLGNLRRPLPLY